MGPAPGIGAGRDRSRLKAAGVQAAILAGFGCLLWLWPNAAAIILFACGALCLAGALTKRKLHARYKDMNWSTGGTGSIRRHPGSPKRIGPKKIAVGIGKGIGWTVLIVVVILPLYLGWTVVNGIIKIFRKPPRERDWPPQDGGGGTSLVGAGLRPPPSTRRASDAKPFPS